MGACCASMNPNAEEFKPDANSTGCVSVISEDQRYFVNPFPSWNELQTSKSDIIASYHHNCFFFFYVTNYALTCQMKYFCRMQWKHRENTINITIKFGSRIY